MYLLRPHSIARYDPTNLLGRMADILEKETNVYMASDPDPFEERHPCRVAPVIFPYPAT